MEASSLPLSIIIIGVGTANFAAMDILDGDIVRLSHEGKYAERDIVQFVPYRDSFSWMATICPEVVGKWSSSYDGTSHLAKVKLAKEVLAEIPDQLTSFMKSRQLVPVKRSAQPTVTTTSGSNNTVPGANTTTTPNHTNSSPTNGVGDRSPKKKHSTASNNASASSSSGSRSRNHKSSSNNTITRKASCESDVPSAPAQTQKNT